MLQGVHIDQEEVALLDSVADRFSTAVEKGDVEGIRQLYSPATRVWHNFTDQAATGEEHLAVLGAVFSQVEVLRLERVSRSFLPGGFLQQHVMSGRDRQGTGFSCPAVMKVDVQDGCISRIEEYFDPSQMPEITGPDEGET